MPEERRILPQDAEVLARNLREAFDSGKDSLSVPWFERSLSLERVSDEEYLVRQPGTPTSGRVILGTGSRPANYPADLPYVPDEIVMLSSTVRHTMATWWSTGEVSTIFAEIERQCAAAGWTRRDAPPVPHEDVTLRVYEQAGRLRHLTLGQGIVSLIETEPPERSG